MIDHPTGKARVISYPRPDADHMALRDQLRHNDLLLGTLLRDDKDRSYVKIPASSRPIVYEAQSDAPGIFSYGDTKMWRDLGNLLGTLSEKVDGAILASDIMPHVAFVEFIRPGEQQLFLVPSVEQQLRFIEEPFDDRMHYLTQLGQECGERFAEFSPYFSAGFDEAKTR